jgi:TonB family protein
MSPLSLLFSSDQETSRLLRQALYELEFEVEHCSEIFAAVEKLTSKAYDVIVTDFDDGLEASFLLKTSRELKANSGAFTLAITSDRDANAAARKVGADLVLNKPMVTEVAKYSLLTSDAFLRSMRNWLPKLQFGNISRPRSQWREQAVSPNRPSPAQRPNERTSSSHRNLRPAALPIVKSTEPIDLWPYESRNRAKGHHRSSLFVLVAAMAMVFLSVGYVFSEPTRSQAVVTSVATVCEKALAKTTSWLKKPDDADQGTSEWAQNDEGQPSGQRRASRIRVTEIHDPTQAVAPNPVSPPPPVSAQNPTPQSQMARVSTVPVIPDSLRTPIGGTGPVPPRAGTSLLDGLPVDLPEELSARLLLQRVEPSYPARARQAGVQGPVVLRAWIGKDGNIEDLKLIRGSLLLGEAAYHAVKQWKYKPYLLNGQAVETETYVTVNFTLH